MFFLTFYLLFNDPVWEFDLSQVDIYNRPAIAVADEMICIVDAKQRQLLFIDPRTDQFFRAGQKGDGPGEFQSIYDVRWHAESKQYLVIDPRKSRLSLFSEKGQFVDSISLDHHFLKYCPGPGDSLIFLKDNGGQKGSTPTLAQFFWSTGEFKVLWQMSPLEKPVGVHRSDEELKISAKFEWDPGLVLGGNGETLVFNYSSDLKAHVWRENQAIQAFDFQIKRILFEDEDVDRRFSGGAAPFRQKLEPYLELPEVWPTVSQIYVDGEKIWFISPSPQRMLGAQFTVTKLDGRHQKSGSLPFNPKDIHQGYIYWVASDEEENLTLQKVAIDVR